MWSRSWIILSSENKKVANTIRRWISHKRNFSLKKLACKRGESERMEREDCYCLTSFCLLTATLDNTTPHFCRLELSLSFYLLICWPIGYQPLRDAWSHQFSMRKTSFTISRDTRTYKKTENNSRIQGKIFILKMRRFAFSENSSKWKLFVILLVLGLYAFESQWPFLSKNWELTKGSTCVSVNVVRLFTTYKSKKKEEQETKRALDDWNTDTATSEKPKKLISQSECLK